VIFFTEYADPKIANSKFCIASIYWESWSLC